MILACIGLASSSANSNRRAQRYSEVAALVIRTLMRSIPGPPRWALPVTEYLDSDSDRAAVSAGSLAKRRSEKPRPCRVRSAARSFVNASKSLSWSVSPVRLRKAATPTAMLDSKHGHGIAARSALDAPIAPPPRCGDGRAGAYRGAAAFTAGEFFAEARISRRPMSEPQLATPRVRILSKSG